MRLTHDEAYTRLRELAAAPPMYTSQLLATDVLLDLIGDDAITDLYVQIVETNTKEEPDAD